MTWNQRLQRAIVLGAIAAGGSFFTTLSATTDAQILASSAGGAAFSIIAAQMGMAGYRMRRPE